MTGRVPFHSDSPTSTLYKVVNEPPPPILDDIQASKDLKNLVLSTLEKDRAKRPQKGSSIYDSLNSIITLSEIRRRKIAVEDQKVQDAGTSKEVKTKQKKEVKVSSTQPSDKGTAPGKKPRRKSGIFIALGFVLLAAAGAWYYFTQMDKNPAGDTNPLLLQAKKEFTGNDYMNAHRDLLKVVAQNPKNSEARQMMKDCIIKISDLYIKPDLVIIPAGTFVMGNDAGGGDEKPQHSVTLSSFQLSKTEITNKQFVVFLNALGCAGSGTINNIKIIDLSRNKKIVFENGIFKTGSDSENLPVTGVTWSGADLFCKTFSGRLPTEAEWEYSAMGGENNVYSGSNELNEIAWFKENSSGQLNNVGTKKPNGYGIYDLTGNVWEWCYDFYDKTYYKSSAPLNPLGPVSGSNKVIRGGDYLSPKESLSNKFRSNSNIAGTTGDVIGFRICIPIK
jgi:formylglycine-generating enzyme required for sulfatase activity